MPAPTAIQDRYPDEFAVCYGCGRLNAHGLHVRSRPVGDECVASFTPRPEHTAVPGFVYGGLLASLIDCHAIGTAAAAAERTEQAERTEPAGQAKHADRHEEHERRVTPAPRFVTASLQVDYLAPTPLGPQLELRARVVEASARKAVVEATITVQGVTTVRGRVVGVRIPDSMRNR